MSIKDGGPAFPARHFDLAPDEHGMTLRDYFAAVALPPMVEHYGPAHAAEAAYKYADAMLKSREVQP